MNSISSDRSRGGVARHRVRERLRQMIHAGRIKPGQKLVQHRLAEQLNVGKGVIREALMELRCYGLVDSIDNRGMFVGTNSRKRLLESYDVRAMLEALAARQCCDHITRAQVRTLEAMVQQIFELATNKKPEGAAALDREFHLRLVEISGNETVRGLMAEDRFLTKVVWAKTDPARTRDGHLALLKAIEENNPDEAERLVREHIRIGRGIVEEHLAMEQDPPQWVA